MEKETKTPASEKAEKDLKAPVTENTEKEVKAILDRNLMRREDADALYLELRDARQEANSAYGIAEMALKSQKVLEGVIAAVEVINEKVFWVLYEGPLTIRIPFQEAFPTPPEDLADRKNPSAVRCDQILSKSLGVKIPFILTSLSVDPDGGCIANASRVKALERIRAVYFGPNAPTPVKEGNRVNGTILSVGLYSCYITVCGCDVVVPNRELTHRYVADLTEMFLAGEKIKVEIQTIDTQGDIPNLAVSAKPVEMDMFRSNLKRIRISGRNTTKAIGTVISIRREQTNTQSARSIVSLFLDEIGLPAFASELQLKLGDELHTGDKVYFEAHGVTEKGYVHGKITRFIRSR